MNYTQYLMGIDVMNVHMSDAYLFCFNISVGSMHFGWTTV